MKIFEQIFDLHVRHTTSGLVGVNMEDGTTRSLVEAMGYNHLF